MDLVNKIALRVEGADQAAREVTKIKESFDEASKSAGGISASIGGGAGGKDPFDAATAPPPGPNLEERSRESGVRRREGEERVNRNREGQPKPGAGESGFDRGARRAAGATVGVAGGAGSALTSFGTNDPLRAVGTASTSLGGAMTGIAGGIGAIAGLPLMIAGIVGNVMSALASREKERLDTISGSGMAQRMGGNYQEVRALRLRMGRSGIPEQISDALMQAFSQAGGKFRERVIRQGSELAAAYGLDPGSLGQFMGMRVQAGQSGMIQDRTMQIAEASFGRPNVRQFIDSLSESIQTAMERGTRKGSDRFADITQETTTRLAAYTQRAGLTATGATALERQIRQTTYTPAGIQGEEDFRRFMFAHQPGQSYMQTRQNMNAPGAMNRYIQQMRTQMGSGEDFQFWLMSAFPQLSAEQIQAVDVGEQAIGSGFTPAQAPRRRFAGTARGLYRGAQLNPTASMEQSSLAAQGDLNREIGKTINSFRKFAREVDELGVILAVTRAQTGMTGMSTNVRTDGDGD